LLPAAFVFGASFGVIARAAGWGAPAAIAMSATTFAGSAQRAAGHWSSTPGSPASPPVRPRSGCVRRCGAVVVAGALATALVPLAF